MAAAAVVPFVSIDEYLRTTYEPDADYVDGQLEERNLGEYDHSDLQRILITLFANHQKAWGVKAMPELRVQVSPTRYRVPDICVLSASAPREQIVLTPPLLCIEILSPEDRFTRSQRKFQDYLSMGVPEVWVLDPETRTAYVLRLASLTLEHKEGTLRLPNTPVEISVAEVFAVLDE